MDTANVLQIRAALAIVERDLREVRDILAAMARKYRDTPMAGRTHLQQALPVTFGYKAAVWLSSIDRHIERIEQALPRSWSANSPVRPARSPRSARAGWRCRDCSARSLG